MGNNNSEILIWDMPTCCCLHKLVDPPHNFKDPCVMVFSSDNRLLAEGTKTGWLGVWNLLDTPPLREGGLSPSLKGKLPGALEIMRLSFSPNHSGLALLTRVMALRLHEIHVLNMEALLAQTAEDKQELSDGPRALDLRYSECIQVPALSPLMAGPQLLQAHSPNPLMGICPGGRLTMEDDNSIALKIAKTSSGSFTLGSCILKWKRNQTRGEPGTGR